MILIHFSQAWENQKKNLGSLIILEPTTPRIPVCGVYSAYSRPEYDIERSQVRIISGTSDFFPIVLVTSWWTSHDCLATSQLPSFPFSQSLLRNYVLDPVRVNNSPALSNLVPTEGIYFSLYASCHWIRSLNICFADDFVRAGKPLGSHR